MCLGVCVFLPTARVAGTGHGSDDSICGQGGSERFRLKPAIQDLTQETGEEERFTTPSVSL